MEYWINFIWFGLAGNAIFIVIGTLVSLIYVFSLDDEQFIEFKEFVKTRNNVINKFSNKKTILFNLLLNLIPTYSVYTNMIYIWNVLTKNIYFGIMAKDRASPIPMIKYNITKKGS